MRAIIGTGLLAILVGLAGAAQASEGASSPLTGKVWLLSSLAGHAPVAGTQPTLELAKGNASGTGGCNRFSGTYSTSGSSLRIKLGATTQMACATRIMAQERAYFAALAKARSYSVSGGKLTLKGSSGRVLATFKAQTQSLAGTSWEVIAYNNGKEAVVSTLPDTTLTAVFGKDGTLTGSGGCNDYHATYTAKPPKLTFGAVGATRKACSDPDGVMEQESRYFAALATVATYKIEGPRLELRTASGALAVDLRRA